MLMALRQDPYALETAFISVITFGSEAKQVVPLTDVVSFQEPTIEANGTTPLGGLSTFCQIAWRMRSRQRVKRDRKVTGGRSCS
jgi:uncharacterized protein YegL